ncbi:MAG: hypothetical protein ACXWQQ_11755 [Pseudobdellovibrio sp.]
MKFVLAVFLISSNAAAEIKPLMQDLYSITDAMTPYMIDKAKFMDAKNEKEISVLLSEFNQKTSQLKKDKMTQNEDMKFKARLLAENLDEAEKSFLAGYKDYSFWVLKASLNNCFSCHTQKSLNDTDYRPKNFASDLYTRAEFLFIVRNYSEAIPLFEKIIDGYPDNKVTVENLESSAQKLLYYYMDVSRDNSKMLESFNKILLNRKLPTSLRNAVLAWKKYTSTKKMHIDENQKIENTSALESFMKERLKIANQFKFPSQRAIADLDTTHRLYQILDKSKDNEMTPTLLYWLADIEKDYRLSMFDLSAENYLKECMQKFSTQSIAKKCFSLFKDIQINSYTGSRGTELPKSVQDQLNSYENLVNPKSLEMQNH